MLDFLSAPDRVVAMRIGGKIRRADIERAVEAIEERLDRHGHVALYAEIEPLEGVTVEAMGADLRYGLRQLGRLDRFGPTAVVTDEAWVANLSRLEGWMLPSMALRVFPRERAAEAMTYASSEPRTADGTSEDETVGPGIRRIPTDRHDAFAFEVDGHVGDAAMRAVIEEIGAAFDAHPDGIDLLARIRVLPGFDVSTLGSKALWQTKLRSLSRVRRYAIVGGPDWVASTATFLGRFLEPEIRHFAPDEEDRAWAWLDARPLEDGADDGSPDNPRGVGPNGSGDANSPWADRGAA